MQLRMEDPGPKTQTQNLRSLPTLGFILHTVWTFLVKMIFVTSKYQLETDSDISVNIWIKSLFYIQI